MGRPTRVKFTLMNMYSGFCIVIERIDLFLAWPLRGSECLLKEY